MASCPSTVLLYDARDATYNIKSFVPAPNSDNVFDCGSFGSCDQLYNNFASGNETDIGLTMKMNQASSDDLNKQIKYNLAQLADGKIREMAKLAISEFGTIEWFRNNILNYTNPMQLMVYIMSLVIVIGLIIYGLIKTFSMLRESLDSKGLILSVIIFVIATSVILSYIYYFTFDTGTSIMLPSNLTAADDDYINYYKQQGINAEPSRFTRQTHFTFVYIGLLVILIAGLGIIIAKRKLPDNSVINFVGGLLSIGILAYIVASNLYYMLFIPQLILMFIILQTIIQHTGKFKKPIAILVAIVIGIYAIVQSGIDMIGTTVDKCYTVAECDKVKNKNQVNTVYFIFFMLVAISFTVLGFIPDYDGWNLLFMPLFIANS